MKRQGKENPCEKTCEKLSNLKPSFVTVLSVVQKEQAAKLIKGAQQKAVERYWSSKILNPCLEQFDELRDRSDRLTSDKPDSGGSKTNKSLEINRH